MGELLQNTTIPTKQWSDPIGWEELGVFTDPSVKWELLAACMGSIIFFLLQFRLA